MSAMTVAMGDERTRRGHRRTGTDDPKRLSPAVGVMCADGYGSLALGRRLRPGARNHQGSFLVFGFGLADPTHRFLGILPELISL
jgi:hypothetical protein